MAIIDMTKSMIAMNQYSYSFHLFHAFHGLEFFDKLIKSCRVLNLNCEPEKSPS